MSAHAKLHITLEGMAARDVALLSRIDIPDLWHVAHSKQWFPSEAERDVMLTIWRIAHHLKYALKAAISRPRTKQTKTQGGS